MWDIFIIRFVIPVVFTINILECVCTCLTQLYVGRDVYNLLQKINYMFRAFSLAIFRLIIEKFFNYQPGDGISWCPSAIPICLCQRVWRESCPCAWHEGMWGVEV